MHAELYRYAQARNLVARPGFAPERAHAILMLSSTDGFIGLSGCSSGDIVSDDAQVPRRRSVGEKRYPMAPSAGLPAVQNAIAAAVRGHCGTAAFAHFLLDNNAVVLLRPSGKELENPGLMEKLRLKHAAFWGLLDLACTEVPGWDEFRRVIQTRDTWLESARAQAARMGLKTGRLSLMIDGQELAELDVWHAWWSSFYERCAALAADSPHVKKLEGQIYCVASGKLAPPAAAIERLKCFGPFGAKPTGISLASTNAAGFVAHGYAGPDSTGLSLDGFLHVKAALDDLCARRAYQVRGLPGVHLCWSVADKLDTSLPSFLAEVFSEDVDTFLDSLVGKRPAAPACDEAAPAEDAPVVDTAASRRATQILRSLDGARLVAAPDAVVYHLRLGGTSRLRVQHFASQPLHALHGHLSAWFRDLRIDLPWLHTAVEGVNRAQRNPYSLERLLRSLSQMPGERQSWMNTLPPEAHRELADAAFFGKALSPTVLDTVTHRCLDAFHRPEHLDDGSFADLMDSRVALLKLCLVRAGVGGLLPSASPEHSSSAYQLGRLLALCTTVQRLALGPVQGTLAVQFFRALSLRPDAGTLQRILTLTKYHTNALFRKEPGLALFFKGQVNATHARVRDCLPARMSRLDRALYLLGFYQQAGSARGKPVLSPLAQTTQENLYE